MPISKVDKEKRQVVGYATTEDIDKQNEQVDFEASKEAFSNWTGNIREMHEPKAVGKAIAWEPDEEKRAIRVTAQISKGAEDTWQKVLDGTLTSFSIGGQTVNKVQQIIKDDKGGQKNVTKITKYRLTELSLVDNPANPAATIELVKFANEVSMQTEVVEDIKKVLISQSEDILESEIKEHRGKADALAKKIMTQEELDKLDSEHWGVIRKYDKDDTKVIERLLPMPDKVHAVRALAVIDKYTLTKEEQDRVHEIAKSVLGSDYETYAINTSRGGEIKKMNNELLDTLKSLGKQIADLSEKVFSLEKANMAAPAKEPKTQEEIKNGAPDNSAPEKTGNFEADGVTPKLKEAKPATPTLKTQEEGNVAPVKKDDSAPTEDVELDEFGKPKKKKIEEAEIKDEMPNTEKAAEPATSSVETQTAPAAPVVEKAASPATSDLKTQEAPAAPVATAPATKVVSVKPAPAPALTAKKSLEAEGSEKITKVTNDLLLAEIKSLRKRLDDVEKQPMPRKYKVEKNFVSTTPTDPSSGLEEDMQKCLELRKQEQGGKKLTAEENAFIQKTLDRSLGQKFSKNQ